MKNNLLTLVALVFCLSAQAAPKVASNSSGKIKGIENAISKSPQKGRNTVTLAQLDVCIGSSLVDSLMNRSGEQNLSVCKAAPLQSPSCDQALKNMLCAKQFPCQAGFHENEIGCAADVLSCEVNNGAGQQVWNGNSYSACTLVSCNIGFHEEAGAGCVNNIQSCVVENGEGNQSWLGSSYGTCISSSCSIGYVLDGGACLLAIATAPPKIQEIKAWINASDKSSLNHGLIADAQIVSSWSNLSVPASSPTGPIYRAVGPKGLPTVDFSNYGGMKLVPVSPLVNDGNFTISVVFSVTPGVSAWDKALCTGNGASLALGVAYGGGYMMGLNGGWGYYGYDGLKPSSEYVVMTVVGNTVDKTLKLYRDGILIVTHTTYGTDTALITLDNLSLGNVDSWWTPPLMGTIPEVVVYDKTMSVTDITKLHEYLIHKYSITAIQ